jgi:transposase-like protein
VTSSASASAFAGFRFPREVISVSVRWYLRYGLSYRDVEELLAERGVDVDHVTVYRWVQRFTPEFVEAARLRRHCPGDRWFVDETYVKVAGRWTYLYRAIDQHGQVIDVWLSLRRDLTAARAFFSRALASGTEPVEVTTDRAATYSRVLNEFVPGALHGHCCVESSPSPGAARSSPPSANRPQIGSRWVRWGRNGSSSDRDVSVAREDLLSRDRVHAQCNSALQG